MRCLVHLDMDCFYAQVEAVRLGIDCRTTPYALVQWGNLIAVNYPARDLGVKRFQDTPKEAQERHPELRLSHIATYEAGSRVAGYPEEAGDDLKHEVEGETKRTKKCEATNSTGAAGRVPRIATHKVALEPYREASRRIFSILRSAEGVSVGKAGIDEAYLDVTEAARRELAELTSRNASGAPLDAFKDVMEPTTRLIEERTEELEAFCTSHGTSLEAVYDGPMRALKREGGARAGEGSVAYCVRQGSSAAELEELAANTLLLCAATRVVKRLRDRIYEQLHYDCSAGIAHNRLLAKAISATHKPNQQTLLLPDRVASALFPVKLSQLRGFGGKFGDAVTAACGGAEWCREAWLTPFQQLSMLSSAGAREGTAGTWGNDDDSGGREERGDEETEDTKPPGKRCHTVAVSRGAWYDLTSWSSGANKGSTFATSALSSNGNSTERYAYFRMRGFGEDTLSERTLVKTLMASKNFSPPTSQLSGLRQWVVVLAAELASRYDEFTATYDLKGRNFNIKLGCGLYHIASVANHTVPLPELVTPDSLTTVAEREIAAILAPLTQRRQQQQERGVAIKQEARGRAAEAASAWSLIHVSTVTLTIGGFVSASAANRAPQQLTLAAYFGKEGKTRTTDTHGVAATNAIEIQDEAVVVTLTSTTSTLEAVTQGSSDEDGHDSSVVYVDATPPSDNSTVHVAEGSKKNLLGGVGTLESCDIIVVDDDDGEDVEKENSDDDDACRCD